MATWTPGQAWPGTLGGVTGGTGYPWGTSIQLFVRAGLYAGSSWRMGPDPADRFDAGNVMGPTSPTAHPPTINGRLWIDLACDVIQADIVDGSTTAAGIFSRDEAATIVVDLLDPDRTYDPLNTAGDYWYQGHTRLVAGTPVEAFAEVVDPTTATITKYQLFTGTSDSWVHALDPIALQRRTKLTASGAVKAISHTDWPEQPAQGGGETTAQRIARIVTYFGYTAPVVQVGTASTVTLQATTLAQSFWELLNRTLDDELGYVHVLPDGTIRWLTRNVWSTSPPPVITLGCKPGVTAYDIVTNLAMGTVDAQLRNAVYAARTGGVQQVAKSAPSIALHGGYETALNRTDLGLNDDTQVAAWANLLIMLYAYPQPAPGLLQMLPAVHGETTGTIWKAVLGIQYASDLARIVWTPTDGTGPIDTAVRVVGVKHTITPSSWQVDWQLVPAQLTAGNIWNIGPDPADQVNRGNVIGY
jgi:hypothetical protein